MSAIYWQPLLFGPERTTAIIFSANCYPFLLLRRSSTPRHFVRGPRLRPRRANYFGLVDRCGEAAVSSCDLWQRPLTSSVRAPCCAALTIAIYLQLGIVSEAYASLCHARHCKWTSYRFDLGQPFLLSGSGSGLERAPIGRNSKSRIESIWKHQPYSMKRKKGRNYSRDSGTIEQVGSQLYTELFAPISSSGKAKMN